jgi:hypothetical protein
MGMFFLCREIVREGDLLHIFLFFKNASVVVVDASEGSCSVAEKVIDHFAVAFASCRKIDRRSSNDIYPAYSAGSTFPSFHLSKAKACTQSRRWSRFFIIKCPVLSM